MQAESTDRQERFRRRRPLGHRLLLPARRQLVRVQQHGRVLADAVRVRRDAAGHRRLRRRRQERHRLLPPRQRQLVHLRRAPKGFWQTQFGYAGTIPVVGDFDGDGTGRHRLSTTRRAATGTSSRARRASGRRSSATPGRSRWSGTSTATAGTTSAATTRRAATGTSSRARRASGRRQFGYAGTIPVVGDFDGDGRDDIGCYYPPGGNWYVFKSTEGFWQTQFGYAGTEPVVGDFDGDGGSDIGCYYPPAATGTSSRARKASGRRSSATRGRSRSAARCASRGIPSASRRRLRNTPGRGSERAPPRRLLPGKAVGPILPGSGAPPAR